MSEAKNIHEAINEVMQEVGYVQKGKPQGSQLNYTYAGERALIQALRPSMVSHGIYMYVKQVKDVKREQYTTAKGTQMTNSTITAVVSFVHAPSNTYIDAESTGEGSDSGDKSQNKAMTGLYKYALRQTFCIETGDDPDQFSSDEQERPAKVLPTKPVPENHTPKPATDLQKLKVEFSQVFQKAKSLGIEIPPINGKATAEEIQSAIKAINNQIAQVA